MKQLIGMVAFVAFLGCSMLPSLALAGEEKKEEKKGGNVVVFGEEKKDEKKAGGK